ncbi:MAG: segregation/condensation protein A [Calditrichia bacterium]
MTYKIKLPAFEGPFDLLLYLIKKNEVDIYDIPIADITAQYLEYIELMKMMDLDVAGEFIEMVATLILIKVRLLLPRPATDGDDDVEDPRAALVAQLLEYKQFKEASSELGELEYRRSRHYARQVPPPGSRKTADDTDFLEDVSLFDLLTAFRQALDNMPKVTVHQVNVIRTTIEDQVAYLFRQMKGKPYGIFSELIGGVKLKIDLIITFMSILDLVRLGFLSAKQSGIYGEIRLVPMRDLNFERYLEVRDKELMPPSEPKQAAQ